MFSIMDQLEQQFADWLAVYQLLENNNPTFLTEGQTGRQAMLTEIQRLITETKMARQAEENAFRNRDAAIAENELLKRKVIYLKTILNCCY
jgi:hypothetical protein